METVKVFIFLGSKITVDSDCSHEIKTRLQKLYKVIQYALLAITHGKYHHGALKSSL